MSSTTTNVGVNVETNESLRQIFKAGPLVLRRERVSDGVNAATDETRVMVTGVAVSRQEQWPKATSGDLRRMAEACIAAAQAMEADGS